MYQALYRKYRPSNFNEIAGQQVVVKTLKNAISNDRLSHAYLFTGPRGTGKTSIAKIVAKTINCENLNDFIPCDKCKSCLEFNSKNDVDIIEIDAASNNGVDEIREIRNKIDLVPSFSRFKVYIIDEVHMLTTGAFNALLKTLEEPPSHIIFILATTEPHKIPATILSRCQRFDFKRISLDDIVSRLEYISKTEGLDISRDVLLEIARLSDGGLRDSISLLDQVISYADSDITVSDVHEVNGTLTQDELKLFFDDVIGMNYENVFSKIYTYNNNGKNLVKIVESIVSFIKNILLYYDAPEFLKSCGYDLDVYKDYDISSDKLIKCINEFNECLINMKKSNNFQLTLEMCLLNISNIFNEKVEVKEVVKTEVKENKVKIDKVSVVHKNKFDDSLFKKIRVENALSDFNKGILRDILGSIDNFKNYVLDNELGKYASMIMDGKLKAASNEYLVFVYDNGDLANTFNSCFKGIESLVVKVLSKNYKVVSVPIDEWESIRDLFNGKKKQFVYVPENGQFDSVNESTDEIASMFDGVVEYNQERGDFMNIQAMMKQAQQLQKKMMDEKKAIDSKVFTGKSSLVSITMTGDKKVTGVDINMDSIESDDKEMLEDMIMLAVNDAITQIDKETEEKMGKYTQGLPGLF